MPDEDGIVIPLPVKSIAAMMRVDLLCGDDGKAWIIHEKGLPGGVNWAELDAEQARMALVNEQGRAFDLGLPIHETLCRRLLRLCEITAVLVHDGAIARTRTLPLIVQPLLRLH